MQRTLLVILVLAMATGDPKHNSAQAIADRHLNVAIGKSISQPGGQTVIYDRNKMVDGKDATVAYLYFGRAVTLTIDLGRSYTVRHVVLRLTPEAYNELHNVSALLSYSSIHNIPTLHHTFLTDACVKPKKHENDVYIIHLYRCCGRCCLWRLRGIGRFLKVRIEKKHDSLAAFGIQEIEVRGLLSPEGLNLALFKPVLEEQHDTSCQGRAFVTNDAWSDELHLQVKRPPFRWRVDLGRAHELGYVRFVYAGKWGDAQLFLMDDVGTPHLDAGCPQVRAEFHQKNTICCETSSVGVAARWLEVRGRRSLPQLVEVFVYPRSFNLMLDECPRVTTPASTTATTATTVPSTPRPTAARRPVPAAPTRRPATTARWGPTSPVYAVQLAASDAARRRPPVAMTLVGVAAASLLGWRAAR